MAKPKKTMTGYCLACKGEVQFTPSSSGPLKNGATMWKGEDAKGHKVSTITK